MPRLIALLSSLALGLVLGACAGPPLPAPVKVTFNKAPTSASLPLEWRDGESVEKLFPRLLPSFTDERVAAGKRFLANEVKITPEWLAKHKHLTLVVTNATGRDGVRDLALTKVADGYQVNIEEVSQGFSQSVQITCDAQLRMLEYTSRRERSEGAIKRTSRIICSWTEKGKGRKGYRIASSGSPEKFMRLNDPLVPDELALLLFSFAPKTKLNADFQIFSPTFRSVYGCELRVRTPSKALPDQGERLVQVYMRTPLGRRVWLHLNSKGEAISGFDEGGNRYYLSTRADLATFRLLYALREAEWDSLVFDGESLSSHRDKSGAKIDKDDARASDQAWFTMKVDALDMVVSPQTERRSAVIAHLSDADTLDKYKSRVSRQDFSDEARPGAAFGKEERHLVVLLEAKPKRLSLKEFALGAASVELRTGEVDGYRRESLKVSGYPAERYEYVIRRKARKGKREILLPPLFHSVVMIDINGVILRVAVTIGDDWKNFTGGVRAIQESIRVRGLPIKAVRK